MYHSALKYNRIKLFLLSAYFKQYSCMFSDIYSIYSIAMFALMSPSLQSIRRFKCLLSHQNSWCI